MWASKSEVEWGGWGEVRRGEENLSGGKVRKEKVILTVYTSKRSINNNKNTPINTVKIS